jgi:hypothetical protein
MGKDGYQSIFAITLWFFHLLMVDSERFSANHFAYSDSKLLVSIAFFLSQFG